MQETYPAWFDQEGLPHQTMPATTFAPWIDSLLALNNASVSIYMAFGGTNFGFSAGADVFFNVSILWFQYGAITTSYDYDAPISEAGDPGSKFLPLKTVFSK
jgi:beta-galactosidase